MQKIILVFFNAAKNLFTKMNEHCQNMEPLLKIEKSFKTALKQFISSDNQGF
jgi:hypothetical protein